jgi:2-dehydro-3-deoxyphosphogluconate aldolase/(4S)-4-hydroxy-2-oxoglutarate aldolase
MKFWDKDSSIDILNYTNINFIAAGGLSINDLRTYKSLGYKAVVYWR